MNDDKKINIFVTAPLKYPEINTIKYEAAQKQIVLEIVLSGKMEKTNKEYFLHMIKNCIYLYNNLYKKKTKILNIYLAHEAGLDFLRFCRDEETICEGEIDLFISLVKEYFGSAVVSQEDYSFNHDTEKIIRDIKEKTLLPYKMRDFLAYREENRVFFITN